MGFVRRNLIDGKTEIVVKKEEEVWLWTKNDGSKLKTFFLVVFFLPNILGSKLAYLGQVWMVLHTLGRNRRRLLCAFLEFLYIAIELHLHVTVYEKLAFQEF